MIEDELEYCVVQRMVCAVTLHLQYRTRRNDFAGAEKRGVL
jgi:hypothetical protein